MIFSDIEPPQFPHMDFDYKMNMRPTEVNWFQLHDQSPNVLQAKKEAVQLHQSEAIFYTPEIEDCFKEVLSLFGDASFTPDIKGFLQLTQAWEPDFVIMQRHPSGTDPVMAGASLCLPSSWNPSEKMGKSITEIHAAVPQLNEKIGSNIARFLTHFRTGIVYDRWFWGLAATSELNMHPNHQLEKLTDATALEKIFVRYEHQAFIVLPQTESVLFMIRPIPIALPDFAANPLNAVALMHQLTTMPEDIQEYKGIPDTLKARLIQSLENV